MSTRAIIAMPTANGFQGAWNWCDGMPSSLGETLRQFFTDEQSVNELIQQVSFDGVHTAKEKQEYEAWMKRDGITNTFKTFQKLNMQKEIYVSKDERDRFQKPLFYQSIEDMLQEDINYVYVFGNGEWKTYR